MVLVWASRCGPGFSILGLLSLLLIAFPDVIPSAVRLCLPSMGSSINLPRRVFVVYSVVVHLNMFAFTARLAYSLFRMIKETQQALTVSDYSQSLETKECPLVDTLKAVNPEDSVNQTEEMVHVIILPNYMEDIDTLRTTLAVLASHPRARSQYEVSFSLPHVEVANNRSQVCLAMEQKEVDVHETAAKLLSSFEASFLRVQSTFHPANMPGEIAGKGSNVAFAARYIVEQHRPSLMGDSSNVIITVIDGSSFSPASTGIQF